MIDRPLTWRERASLIWAAVRGRTVTTDEEPIGFQVTPRPPARAKPKMPPVLLIAPTMHQAIYLSQDVERLFGQRVIPLSANDSSLPSRLCGWHGCTILLSQTEDYPDEAYDVIEASAPGNRIFYFRERPPG